METKGDKWQVGGWKGILRLNDREYSDAFDEEEKQYRCTQATQGRRERERERKKESELHIIIGTITTTSTIQQ